MAGIVNILLWTSTAWYAKYGINDTAIVIATSAALQAFGVGKACLWDHHEEYMFEGYEYGVIRMSSGVFQRNSTYNYPVFVIACFWLLRFLYVDNAQELSETTE